MTANFVVLLDHVSIWHAWQVMITATQAMLQTQRVSNKLYFCKWSLFNHKFLFMN